MCAEWNCGIYRRRSESAGYGRSDCGNQGERRHGCSDHQTVESGNDSGENAVGDRIRNICGCHGCGCCRTSVSEKHDTAGRKQERQGTCGNCEYGRRAVYRERCYDGQRSAESKRSRSSSNRGFQSRRTCSGSVPGDGRSPGRNCRRSRRFYEDSGGRRNPLRNRYL